jgi:hypothetical protein
LKFKGYFRGKCCFHLQSRKNKPRKKPAWSRWEVDLWRRYVPPIRTTRRHIREYRPLHIHRCENLSSSSHIILHFGALFILSKNKMCTVLYSTCNMYTLSLNPLSFRDFIKSRYCGILINCCITYSDCQDSVVGVATGYGLDGQGVGVPSPARVKNFLHVVQTGSGVHQTSYPMDTGNYFPGGKAAVA